MALRGSGFTLRRSEHELRIEIMPMIDVIFLLLTFFIYAMVLMVRAELLPMRLQSFAAAAPAALGRTATVSLRLDGSLHLDRKPVALGELPALLKARIAEDPDTTVIVAIEEGSGEIDRAPLLTGLIDGLVAAGLDFGFVGPRRDREPGP